VSRAEGEQGDSLAAAVELYDQTWRVRHLGRRTFLRWVGIGLKSGAAGIAFVAGMGTVVTLAERTWEYDPQTDKRLLDTLFGLGRSPSAAIVPASDHPFVPLAAGEIWYPATAVAGRAYRDRFFPSVELRTVRGYPNIRQQDSVVVFGSQNSNSVGRRHLGNPWEAEPIFLATGEGWRATLSWNIHTPPAAALMEYMQFGTRWRVANHQVVASDGTIYRPKAGIEWMQDDYLLITALPRFRNGPQKLLLFGGAHGLATQATTVLLSQPPLRELRRLFALVRGEPFYQALFRVTVIKTQNGVFQPGPLELVDARPIDVEFSQA
jgi:hypothetical protein